MVQVAQTEMGSWWGKLPCLSVWLLCALFYLLIATTVQKSEAPRRPWGTGSLNKHAGPTDPWCWKDCGQHARLLADDWAVELVTTSLPQTPSLLLSLERALELARKYCGGARLPKIFMQPPKLRVDEATKRHLEERAREVS